MYSTNLSTCPVCAFTLFAEKIEIVPPYKLVFSAVIFLPQTQSKLTETIRHLLMQAGMYPSNCASHTFKIGAATTAAAA